MPENLDNKIRINKALSSIFSRRQADKAIADMRIEVNGKIATCGQMVCPEDSIYIDGIELSRNQEVSLFLYHKPPKCLVSRSNQNNMQTIFDIMPKIDERLIYCGRLDFLSEGLLLLTNSATLSHFLTNNNHIRKYIIYTPDFFSDNQIEMINRGICINGRNYKSIQVKCIDKIGYEFTLNEGQNREIRNIFRYFGLRILRLIRTQYHIFTLDNIKPNCLRKVDYNTTLSLSSFINKF